MSKKRKRSTNRFNQGSQRISDSKPLNKTLLDTRLFNVRVVTRTFDSLDKVRDSYDRTKKNVQNLPGIRNYRKAKQELHKRLSLADPRAVPEHIKERI